MKKPKVIQIIPASGCWAVYYLKGSSNGPAMSRSALVAWGLTDNGDLVGFTARGLASKIAGFHHYDADADAAAGGPKPLHE